MPTWPKYVSRFRVKNGSKKWTDQGPDLLRPRDNARHKLAGMIHDRRQMWVKLNDNDWRKAGGPRVVLEAFDAWRGAMFRVGVKVELAGGETKVRSIAVVKREQVPYVVLNNCSPNTNLGWSLFHFQFPEALFAGGYVYKQVKGSTSWSDHSWGTAFDVTRQGNDTIRKLTSYASRLARERCYRFDYALGSFNGRDVVYIDGHTGESRPSRASDSHTWHLHTSETDHDGRKPPREGGVW